MYVELSVHYDTLEALGAALSGHPFARLALPWDAAFVAGKAYRRYRSRGGAKRSPLPDFYIGAHAAVAGLALLTRDAKRYREYFPRLRLMALAAGANLIVSDGDNLLTLKHYQGTSGDLHARIILI